MWKRREGFRHDMREAGVTDIANPAGEVKASN
jgi:hypothetical protein